MGVKTRNKVLTVVGGGIEVETRSGNTIPVPVEFGSTEDVLSFLNNLGEDIIRSNGFVRSRTKELLTSTLARDTTLTDLLLEQPALAKIVALRQEADRYQDQVNDLSTELAELRSGVDADPAVQIERHARLLTAYDERHHFENLHSSIIQELKLGQHNRIYQRFDELRRAHRLQLRDLGSAVSAYLDGGDRESLGIAADDWHRYVDTLPAAVAAKPWTEPLVDSASSSVVEGDDTYYD